MCVSHVSSQSAPGTPGRCFEGADPTAQGLSAFQGCPVFLQLTFIVRFESTIITKILEFTGN